MIRPRLTGVLLLLTAVVALFGWRIAGDTSVRQADQLTREAIRLFAAWRAAPPAAAPPPAGAEEAAERASVLVGRPVSVPRGGEFSYLATTAQKAGRARGAALRFQAGPDPFLLLVVARDGVFARTRDAASSPFPGASFLSGARDGVSFVLWKRDGLFYCLVSDRDLTRVFEVVRRQFPG